MVFQNPQNGYIEERSHPWLWCLLFNFFYFIYLGIWRHAVLAFVLTCATGPIFWLIYPFYANRVVRQHYLAQGWIDLTPPPAK